MDQTIGDKYTQKIEKLTEAKSKFQEAQKSLDELEKSYTSKATSKDAQMSRRQVLKSVGKMMAIRAIIDAGITLIISCNQEIRDYRKGKITMKELIVNVASRTSVAAVRGASIPAAIALPQVGGQWLATNGSSVLLRSSGTVLSTMGKLAGPLLMTAGITYQSYTILQVTCRH
jgi:hypothetical protein